MKKRMVGASAAIVLALSGTLVLLGYVKSAHAKAESGEAQKSVLVVTAPVAKGTPVEQLRQAVIVRTMPVSLVAPSALGQLDSINGTVTSIDRTNGNFVVDIGSGTRITVSMPYNARSADVSTYNNLRVGQYVRFYGVYLNTTRVELRQFY